MKWIIVVCGAALLIAGCGDLKEGTVGPVDIGGDLWNDLTVIGDEFFTTNYDGNEGPGDRIYLYRLDTLGVMIDSVNLGMNGQEYCSITDDETDFYVAGSSYGTRFRFSPSGRMKAFSRELPGVGGWMQGGIAYHTIWDSVYVLMWHVNDPGTVRLYSVNRETMDMLNYRLFTVSDGYDYFAMTCKDVNFDSCFHFLCRKTNEEHTVFWMQFNHDTGSVRINGLCNDDIRGITSRNGYILAIYEDHRIFSLHPVATHKP